MAWGLERQAGPATQPLMGKKDEGFRDVLGTLNVHQDNMEPRISKLDKCVSSWKKHSFSLIGKVSLLNIVGLSKLLFVSSILTPPRWVCDPVNQIIWPFLWGSLVETVARRTLICSVPDRGGLGLEIFVPRARLCVWLF